MPNPLNFVQHAVGQADQHKSFLSAVVRPLPAAHTAPLNVSLSWTPSTSLSIAPGSWTPMHGHVMPKEGDSALIVVDDERYARCIWWGPSAAAEPNPVTIAKAYASSAATASAGLSASATVAGWNQVPLDSRGFDSGENLSGSPFRYTTRHQGIYRCSGQVEITGAAGLEAYVSIFRNGAEASRGSHVFLSSADLVTGLVVGDLIPCLDGDTLDIRVYTSTPVVYTNCVGPSDGDIQVGVSNHFSVEFVSTW